MRLEPLGELVPDPHIPEWVVAGPVSVPYFDGTMLPFILENVADDGNPDDFRASTATAQR